MVVVVVVVFLLDFFLFLPPKSSPKLISNSLSKNSSSSKSSSSSSKISKAFLGSFFVFLFLKGILASCFLFLFLFASFTDSRLLIYSVFFTLKTSPESPLFVFISSVNCSSTFPSFLVFDVYLSIFVLLPLFPE